VYLSFIIKAVAAERVAECGGLLLKSSVFLIYFKLHCTLLKQEQKVADVCQNRLTSLLAVVTNFNKTINLYSCQP
jgi:hypothetical protein